MRSELLPYLAFSHVHSLAFPHATFTWQGGHCWSRVAGQKLLLVHAEMLLIVTGIMYPKIPGHPRHSFSARLWCPGSLRVFCPLKIFLLSFWTSFFSVKPCLLFLNPAFFGTSSFQKASPLFFPSLYAKAECVVIVLTGGSPSCSFY